MSHSHKFVLVHKCGKGISIHTYLAYFSLLSLAIPTSFMHEPMRTLPVDPGGFTHHKIPFKYSILNTGTESLKHLTLEWQEIIRQMAEAGRKSDKKKTCHCLTEG